MTSPQLEAAAARTRTEAQARGQWQTVENPWGKWDIFHTSDENRTIEVAETKLDAIARCGDLNRGGALPANGLSRAIFGEQK